MACIEFQNPNYLTCKHAFFEAQRDNILFIYFYCFTLWIVHISFITTCPVLILHLMKWNFVDYIWKYKVLRCGKIDEKFIIWFSLSSFKLYILCTRVCSILFCLCWVLMRSKAYYQSIFQFRLESWLHVCMELCTFSMLILASLLPCLIYWN